MWNIILGYKELDVSGGIDNQRTKHFILIKMLCPLVISTIIGTSNVVYPKMILHNGSHVIRHCYVKFSIFWFVMPNFCQYTYVKSKTGHIYKWKLFSGLFITHSLTYSSCRLGRRKYIHTTKDKLQGARCIIAGIYWEKNVAFTVSNSWGTFMYQNYKVNTLNE